MCQQTAFYKKLLSISLPLATMLILLPACGESGSTPTKKKYVVDDGAIETGHEGHNHAPGEGHDHSHTQPGSGDLANDGWKKDLSGEDSTNRIIAYAGMLQARQQQVSPDQRLSDRVAMLEISNELESRDLSEQQLVAMFQIKSESLMQLISAGQNDYRKDLGELVEKYRNNSNANIARSATFLKLTRSIKDYFRNGEKDFSEPEQNFISIAETYKDDPQVAQALTTTLAKLNFDGKGAEVAEVFKKLIDVYGQSSNEAIKTNIPKEFNDRIFLIESQFDEIAKEAAGGVSEEAIVRFQDCIRKLARRKGTPHFYNKTLAGARLLESQSLFDDMKQIYDLLEESYKDHANEQLLAKVTKDIELGRRRADLIGNSVNIVGNREDATPFDPELLNGKPTLVFFWSASIPASARVMQRLLPIHHLFKGQGLEIVAICIDQDVLRATNIFQGKYPPWINLFTNPDDGTAYENMLVEFGIQMVPYLILIDQDGKVADIHVSPDLVDQSIKKMLNIEE